MKSVIALVRLVWSTMVAYLIKFGTVGLICYVIDVGIFNVLIATAMSPARIHEGPLFAKLISTSVAVIASWFGNRFWTFRENRRRNFVLELLEFAAVAILGLLIGLLCLWVSHYLLGLTSTLADNISANVVGLVIGTVVRFVLYRYWVYGLHRKDGLSADKYRAEAAEMSLFEDVSTANIEIARAAKTGNEPAT